MVEAEVVGPVADHTPAVEQDDADHDDVEHGLGADLVVLLKPPVRADAHALGHDAHDKEVG